MRLLLASGGDVSIVFLDFRFIRIASVTIKIASRYFEKYQSDALKQETAEDKIVFFLLSGILISFFISANEDAAVA